MANIKELYRRAKTGSQFDADLKVFRKKYRIPLVQEQLGQWLIEKYEIALLFLHHDPVIMNKQSYKGFRGGDYFYDRMKLLDKYGFPISGYGEAMDDLLQDRIPTVGYVEIEGYSIAEKMQRGSRYFKLVVYEGASRAEAHKILSSRLGWRFLSSSGTRYKSKRTRTSKIERDELIYKLWKSSKFDLGFPEADYKQIAVAAHLLQEYKIKMEPDAVETAYYRYLKRKKTVK